MIGVAPPRKPGGPVDTLVVIIRHYVLKDIPLWLKPGAPVSALVGTDKDAGSVRLLPVGPFTLAKMGGAGAKRPLMLRIPFPPGVKHGRYPVEAVDHDYNDDWFMFDLPSWAKPDGVMAGASSQPKPIIGDAAVARPPFRGIGSTGPNPHPALQRRAVPA